MKNTTNTLLFLIASILFSINIYADTNEKSTIFNYKFYASPYLEFMEIKNEPAIFLGGDFSLYKYKNTDFGTYISGLIDPIKLDSINGNDRRLIDFNFGTFIENNILNFDNFGINLTNYLGYSAAVAVNTETYKSTSDTENKNSSPNFVGFGVFKPQVSIDYSVNKFIKSGLGVSYSFPFGGRDDPEFNKTDFSGFAAKIYIKAGIF